MSPVGNTPPQVRKQPARTDNRLRELERTRVAAQSPQIATSEEFPGYSVPGLVADGTLLPAWYANLTSHAYTVARVSAIVAPGADCEFHLGLNGFTIAVLTLGTGETTHLYAVSFTVNVNDFLGGNVVLGGGAQFWSMQLEEAV